MTPKPFALYRYFDDGDRLLYVGISGALPVRETAHIARSRWMELAAGSKIERYGTVEDVLTAETIAIKAEQPLFNVQHNDTPEAWGRLWDYLDEIGRPDLLIPKQRRKPAAADPCGQPCGEEPEPAVTRMPAGMFQVEIWHTPGLALKISASSFSSIIPLTTLTAFDLADALQRHAWEAIWQGADGVISPEAMERWNRPAPE